MTKSQGTNRWLVWALLTLGTMAVSPPAGAQGAAGQDKQDTVVREAVRNGKSMRAIVRFKDERSRTRGANTVTRRGGSVGRSLDDIGALNIVVDAATATVLSQDAGVAGISIDAEVRSSATPGPGAARANGGGKTRQHFPKTGRGISIAVIDSGVKPHADLPASRIRKFVDFVNGRTQPYDDFGHGTHVAGILAGSGAASAQLESPYIGMAPEVDIVALKVLDATGAGSTSNVIAALQWVAANYQTYNIRVVNLSLGHPVYEPAATDPLVQAADALVRRGIVVVASAGNLGIDPRDQEVGYGGITSPANGPSVIAVGAVDSNDTDGRGDDRVTNYSSRGPTRFDLLVKPDLVASGHHIVSLSAPGSYLFERYPALRVKGGKEAVAQYFTLNGTSMAAPVVAGTAAMILDANPRLSAGAVRAVLEFTSQHLADSDVMTQGAGYLNAIGAVRLAAEIKPKTAVNSVWLGKSSGVPAAYDELAGDQIEWSKYVVWGDRVMLGDSAYVHLPTWDDNVVWGRDDNIIWGQARNIVWGQRNNIIWGQSRLENIVWGECASAECHNITWDLHDDSVWGQARNIIWGQGRNIIWGQNNVVFGTEGGVLSYWADNTTWGFWSDTVSPSSVTRLNADNIIWGQDYLDNIIWGQGNNIIWGQARNIIWGQSLAILTGVIR